MKVVQYSDSQNQDSEVYHSACPGYAAIFIKLQSPDEVAIKETLELIRQRLKNNL